MKTRCRNLLILPALLSIPLSIFPVYAFFQSDSQSGQPDFKISTNVDLVLLDVGVKDAKGGYAANLPKEAFKVEENGVPQKITAFSNMDVPVAVGLILDDSGSMKHKRKDVATAGLTFVDASNPKDEVFVLDFNDRVLPGLPEDVPFTDDVSLLRTALVKHPAAGRTVLYDAIEAGLNDIKSAHREKKTLIVVSDGGDTASSRTLAQVMQAIEASDVTVYTIGIYDEDDPDNKPDVLRRIAQVSGGECFLLQNAEDIIPTSKKIAEDIRKRYTIGYVPERGSGAALRKIKVTAASPDHGHLLVRTRTSYINPNSK
jgi:Ca-activated chloride channel homolog